MATNENLIPIPGRLHSVATEGHVAGADEIYDDVKEVTQDVLNGAILEEKTYTPADYSGMGRVVLKKNMVSGVNTLTQSMMAQANTIYIILYDFDLAGNTITIPANCVLEFEGGCLSNGTLNFNSTKIVSDSKCFSTDITFGDNGWISNEEVLISWFVAKSDIMIKEDPVHDCHDEIRLASLLAGHMTSGHSFRKGGVLNLECIQLAVMQPIILDSQYDGNLIKNANIHFWSTADGQSIIHYNNDYIVYCPIENSVFNYYGSVETKNIKDVSQKIYHERINAIRFEKCSPTVFSYWRDITTSMLTGYVFVNQTYLQEESFENITSSGCNGMISYNVDGYYEGRKGSSNIITFKNCNLNNGNTTSSYSSKCTIEYLWDFRGFMELTIENAVSQGYGKEGQKAIRLGPGVVYPQSVKLDGFWIEYTYYNVDSKIYIESSTDLHLEKTNVSGFVTKGDTETINIFYNAVASNYYDGNFIDNSTITEGTAQVAIYYKPTTYLAFITLSEKFLEWVDKGIIRVLDTRKYPYGRTAAQNIVSIRPGRQNNMLKYYMKYCIYNSIVWHCLSYVTSYKGINTLTMEHEGDNDGTVYGNSMSSISGMFSEIIYRVAPLIDVTEENKNDIYIKFNIGGSQNIYSPSVGDTAGTFTPWLRKAYIASGSSGFIIKNARIEIAYYTTYGGFGIRDYITFRYDITNQDLVPIIGNEDTQIIEIDSTQTNLTINGIKDYVKINNVIIKFIGNKWAFTGTVYKSEGGITPLTNISGNTNSRPKGLAVGCSYFDTTLGKPIYVKTIDSDTGDITWVDATGATV